MTIRLSADWRVLLPIGVTILVAGAASAAPWTFVGSRQQAMGGTGVAFTDDSLANYWNAANLAYSKGWDVQLPATGNANIENKALEKLSGLIDGFDALDAAATNLLSCQPNCVDVPDLSAAQQQQVVDYLIALDDYGKNGENVNVGVAFGLTGRYDSFGFSALSLTTGTVFPSVDLNNLSLGSAVIDLVEGAACCQLPINSALGNAIATASQGALTPQQGGHLVYLAERAGANTLEPATQQFLYGLAAGGSGTFANNNSGVLTAGLSTQEFGISYSHTIPVPRYRLTSGITHEILSYVHEKFSVGVVPKYMLGVAFVRFFLYEDDANASTIVSELSEFADPVLSSAFGLDIGASYRPTSWFQFGMMARNVNSPSFDVQPFTRPDGQYVSELSLEPQVRVGFALIPVKRLTLALDIDATSNDVATLPGYASQTLSVGAEYVIPFGKRVDLALRLGGYNNIATDFDQDWAMTGGLGLRLWGFHLDLSGGGSFENEDIQTGTTTTTSVPTRMNIGLGLKWEQSL